MEQKKESIPSIKILAYLNNECVGVLPGVRSSDLLSVCCPFSKNIDESDKAGVRIKIEHLLFKACIIDRFDNCNMRFELTGSPSEFAVY